MMPFILSILPIFVPNASSSVYKQGNLRVEFLSEHLVRLEKRGAEGFEDRKTFLVVNRTFPGTPFTKVETDQGLELRTPYYKVVIAGRSGGEGAKVVDEKGETIYEFNDEGKGVPGPSFLPAPSATANYVLADNPRLIPPAWGATPAPDTADETSGWDLGNSAPDVYVFVNGQGGYANLKHDFLRLTGPTEMPPLYAFGFWNSRWYPYSEATALKEINAYRSRRIPLDVFILDTNWRVGGSHGYAVDKKLFPNMKRFLAEAHALGTHIMFNDHPEPVAPTATDPKELAYRYHGLSTFLGIGLDIWWYDRNWSTHLHTPAEPLRPEVWGMRLYHDMTARAKPDQRPLIMTNASGIDNGFQNYPPHASAHRYPIWWTGDTDSKWPFLGRGVANGVNQGAEALMPYVHDDLGGHIGRPTPELYVRYLQFGCLSPITRVHCTYLMDRLPWTFGPEAAKIVPDYIRLRYRLLPTIYAAARRNFEDGTPLLRRCDLEYPKFAAANDASQYFFGDDLLVAPITESIVKPAEPIDRAWFQDTMTGEYFANDSLRGTPTITRNDHMVNFDWGRGPADPVLPATHFSVRWKGKLGPIKKSGDYELSVTSDDGARLWLDGHQLINNWGPQDSTTSSASVHLVAGKSYALKLEYQQLEGSALCRLGWRRKDIKVPTLSKRSVWIPPGEWVNAWTGATTVGPKKVSATAKLAQIPLFVRGGGLILSTPVVQKILPNAWRTVLMDAYPGRTKTNVSRTLYEDDGTSTGYKAGGFAKTEVSLDCRPGRVTVQIQPRRGGYAGALKRRSWRVLVHLGKKSVRAIRVDGRTAHGKLVHGGPASLGGVAITSEFRSKVHGSILQIDLTSGSVERSHVITVETK